jgi:relaxasome subunit MobC
MAKSTKTYEERIRALEKKEQESIEATKKLIAQRKELEKRKKARKVKNEPTGSVRLVAQWNRFLAVRLRRKIYQS